MSQWIRAPRVCACAIAVLAFAPLASPGVIVADASGGGDFNEVQDAVDAASDGDIVFVRPGPYAPVDITNKAITIVSDPAFDATLCTIGRVRVLNLGPTRTVVLSRLTIKGVGFGPAEDDGCGLLVASCAGAVRIQRCVVSGNTQGVNPMPAYPAAIVRTSANVQFMSTSGFGGDGHGLPCGASPSGGDGGSALVFEASNGFVHGGVWRAGDGGFGCAQGGSGGAGIHVASGVVVLSGVHAFGGDGGDAQDVVAPASAIGGAGGAAIVGDAGQTVTLVAVQTTPGIAGTNQLGQPGPAGASIAGGATFVVPPWPARMIAITPAAFEAANITLLIEGAPGELAFLFLSATTGPPLAGPQGGAYALGAPLGPFVLGTMNANGQLVIVFTAPNLPPGILGGGIFLQAALTGPLGAGFTGPAHAMVLDTSL